MPSSFDVKFGYTWSVATSGATEKESALQQYHGVHHDRMDMVQEDAWCLLTLPLTLITTSQRSSWSPSAAGLAGLDLTLLAMCDPGEATCRVT